MTPPTRSPGPSRPGTAVARPEAGRRPEERGGAGARPVTARSVIASILLPLDRPELPARSLVRCCDLFGIAEGTARVALSRMAARHELEHVDGAYRLTGPMLERQARQREGRDPQLRPWDGSWLVAVVVAERRGAGDRAALRRNLRHQRLAELREGVWVRPDNVDVAQAAPSGPPGMAAEVSAQRRAAEVSAQRRAAEVSAQRRAAEVSAQWRVAGHCTWFRAVPAEDLGAPDPGRLAQRLWDLDGWAARARSLIGDLDGTLPRLEAGEATSLAPCFAVAAAAMRHLTDDPLLPASLLPDRWPGEELRERYATYEHAYRRLLTAWIRSDVAGGDPGGVRRGRGQAGGAVAGGARRGHGEPGGADAGRDRRRGAGEGS